MKRTLFIALALILSVASHAEGSDDRKWGIQAGIGGLNISDVTPEGQPQYIGDDEADHIFVSADYYIRKHLALTGGIYFDRVGLLTYYSSDDIGLKKIGNVGVTLGAKYYFLPTKWAVQPFVGASLKTNFMNLGEMKESVLYNSFAKDQNLKVDYDVQCPALRVAPRLGVDVRLLSSLSFCVDYQACYGLWGHSRQTVHFTSGTMTGVVAQRQTSRWQTGFTIGLKMDFPVRKVSSTSRNSLLQYLFFWMLPQR